MFWYSIILAGTGIDDRGCAGAKDTAKAQISACVSTEKKATPVNGNVQDYRYFPAMNAALSQLTREELISLLLTEKQKSNSYEEILKERQAQVLQEQTRLQAKQQEVDYLQAKVAQLQRMLFGQKRERFENPNQLLLPFDATAEQVQQQQQQLTEKIEYVRAKQQKTAHKGRVALPDHLPVEEIEIYPEGDLSEMVCIGKEITEELECVPAHFFIRRYIRYKYAAKDKEGVVIGQLPERVIDKGIPGPGLLSSILVDKYADHLPLYRSTGDSKGSGS